MWNLGDFLTCAREYYCEIVLLTDELLFVCFLVCMFIFSDLMILWHSSLG